MNLGLGADVDAAGRLVHDQDHRTGGEPFAEHHLLLVASGQLTDDLFGAPGPYAEPLDGVAGFFQNPGGIDEKAAHQPAEIGKRHVVGNGLRFDEALRATVLGYVSDAEIARRFRAGDVDGLSLDQDLAGRRWRDAEDRQRGLGAARSDETGEAEDFSPSEGQGNIAHHVSIGDIAKLQRYLAAVALLRWIELIDSTAHHQRHEAGFVDVGDVHGADMGAVAQHGDAVGESENLRHAVADIDDGNARCPELADDVHEALHVRFGKGRCRLVHDDDARLLRQRSGNLDALAIGDRETGDLLVDVEVAAVERVQKLAGAAAHHVPVDGAEPCPGRLAEEDVFGDRQFGKQQQFLVNRGDARGMGLARGRKAPRVSVHDNRAAVGLMKSSHDLDQRGFSRAILAEQGVDFAAADVEGDIGDGLDAGESLVDAAECDGRVRCRCPLSRLAARVNRRLAGHAVASPPLWTRM